MIKPINDFVLLKPDQLQEKTNGGLELISKPKIKTGTVLEIGSKVKYIKKGYKVQFEVYRETQIQDDKQTLYLIKEEYIQLVITK